MEPGIGPGGLPPFHELDEYTFQSLCRDLLDAEDSVETCDEYGTRGQRDYGVDLLAHRADRDGLELGQCKCYSNCTTRDMINVRKEFFKHYGDGKRWQLGTVKRFVLFFACDLSSTNLQDTIVSERKKFRHFGISYEVWGAAKIRNKLRPHPGIVSTYLTPPNHWVEAICGASGQSSPAPLTTNFQQVRVTSMVDSALLQRVGQLESEAAERQLQNMRRSWYEGRYRECIEAIDGMKSPDVWPGLAAETRAKVLRFEASVRLHEEGNVDLARRLADEAHGLSPTDDESKVRALIAHAEFGPMAAVSHLPEHGDADAADLRALYLFESGDYQSCRAALRVFEDGSLKPTVSTAQLRACLNILDGEKELARLEAQKALEMEPRWEGVRFTAAMIDYLSTLSQAAVPEYIVWWPEPVEWVFVKRDEESVVRLRAAAEAFRELSEDVDTPEARHRYAAWRLACLANDPEAQEDAVSYCQNLLEEEPTNYQAILWAAARSFDVNLDRSRDILESMVEDESADIPRVLTFCRLLMLEGKTDETVDLLERCRTKFQDKGAETLWITWYAQALATGGALQAALHSLDELSEDQDRREARAVVLGVQARETGDWKPLLAHLESAYEASADPIFLLDVCEIKARHEKWDYVADRAIELVDGVGTAEVLRLAAMGAHNDSRWELCLELLDGGRGLCPGGTLPRELRQMWISCQRALGRSGTAGVAAEGLARDDPSVVNLSNLFLLRRDQLDRPGMVSVARRLAEHPDLSSEQALGVAEVVLIDDRDLAVSLWRRAVGGGLHDLLVSKALNLGFRLGLDRETAPLTRRALEIGDREDIGLKRLGIQELLEFMEHQRDRSEDIREKYLDGTMPVHFASEALNVPLVEQYHYRLLENEESSIPAESPFLLIEYGGRDTFETLPANIAERRLVLDVTALLLAAHLGILDSIETVFDEIMVPQELGLALLEMRDRVAPSQPSRFEARSAVVRLADAGSFSAEWSEPDYRKPELVEEMGDRWVSAFEQARALGGYIVDFLPLSKLDLSGPPKTLDEDAYEHVTDVRSLLDALRDRGLMSAMRAAEAANVLGKEDREQDGQIAPILGSHLFLDSGIAEYLTGVQLLGTVCSHFTVHVDPEELRRLRVEVHSHETNLKTSQWLTALIDRLNRGLESGSYAAIVAPPSEESEAESLSPVLVCLETVLRYETQDDIIWIDDRAMNRYPGRHGVPIVGIRDILKTLLDAEALQKEEYYSALVRLRAANTRFLPLNGDEILHHLRRAQVRDGEVIETWELRVIRRYAAACLLRGELLKRPEGTESGSVENFGELPFIAQLERAVSDALARLWEGEEDEMEARVRAEWLIANMYLGYAGVTNVVALPGSPEEERSKVVRDLAHLTIWSLLSGTNSDDKDQALQWRLSWLEDRVLSKRFEVDTAIAGMVAREIKERFEEVRVDMEQEAPEPVVSHSFGNLFECLPKPIKDELACDTDFMASVGRRNVTVMQVGDFRFEYEDLWTSAVEAVNDRPASISTMDERPSVFSLHATNNPDALLLTSAETGEEHLFSHELFPLLYESTAAREEYLGQNSHWFDCPGDRLRSAIAEVATISDPLKRLRETGLWRDFSAAFYYEKLSRTLYDRETVLRSDLLPPDIGRLIEHLRLSSESETGPAFCKTAERAAKELIREEGLREALKRFSGLPVQLPSTLLQGVEVLSAEDKSQLVKHLVRQKGSPISRVHLARLLTHIGGEAYLRLARRVALSLLNESGTQEWKAFLVVLRWTNDEFDSWPDMRSLPASLRLAAVWYHAHRLLTAFDSAGLSPERIADLLEATDKRLTSEVFKREDRYWRDICHPRRLNHTTFLYTGLAYGIGKPGDDVVAKALEECPEGGPQKFMLLQDTSLARDSLGSFIGGNRAQTLAPIIGEQDAETLDPALIRTLLEEALDGSNDETQGRFDWRLVYLLLDDHPPPSVLKNRLKDAFLSIDIGALIREDVQSALFALRGACIQAPNINDEDLRLHLEEQLVTAVEHLAVVDRAGESAEYGRIEKRRHKELLSVLDSAIHLSIASLGDQVAHFGELTIRISDAWPEASHFCKLVVLRLCEGLNPPMVKPLYKVLTHFRAG